MSPSVEAQVLAKVVMTIFDDVNLILFGPTTGENPLICNVITLMQRGDNVLNNVQWKY